MCASFESGDCFLQLSCSPKSKPCGLQSQMFWGLVLLVHDPSLGSLCGARTPYSLERTSAINLCNYPPICGSPTRWGGMGVYYTLSPPLLSVSLWFFLYIFSCRRSFSSSLQVFLINSCPANSCTNFGVPMGGGELRVFLLHHLGHSPSSFELFGLLCMPL